MWRPSGGRCTIAVLWIFLSGGLLTFLTDSSPFQVAAWEPAAQSLESISFPTWWLVFLYHSGWLSWMWPETALCCLPLAQATHLWVSPSCTSHSSLRKHTCILCPEKWSQPNWVSDSPSNTVIQHIAFPLDYGNTTPMHYGSQTPGVRLSQWSQWSYSSRLEAGKGKWGGVHVILSRSTLFLLWPLSTFLIWLTGSKVMDWMVNISFENSYFFSVTLFSTG